jgi:hypothetical protein
VGVVVIEHLHFNKFAGMTKATPIYPGPYDYADWSVQRERTMPEKMGKLWMKQSPTSEFSQQFSYRLTARSDNFG